MYPSFLRLHGKSYDYKIPYTTMIRMFLLPHNDQRSVYFVISTDPPIRQGQTRYPHLVIQFIKDDWSDLTLELDEETIATKYEGKLQKEMAGPTYETFSKVMKFVVGQKIFVPGNFVSSAGNQAIACSHKANSGFLYPLEKGFMYVVKPPVHIRFDEVSSVNFSRVASGVGQSRSFDLEIETNTGANYIFASIEKKEYSKLFDFLKSKKIRIQNNKGGDETFNDDFGDGPSASDNETTDHYLEKMKKEGEQRDSNDDSDESEDEDFVAGETPDTSPSSSSESEEEEGADRKKKKKKKVLKETEIGKQKERRSSPKPRKEAGGKKTKAQRKAERDPNKPKKPPTAYFLWLGVNRANIKDKNPGITVTEIAKKAGEMWRSLDSDEKQEYESKANKMKEEYNTAIVEYNKNLAQNPRPVSSAPKVKSSKSSSKPSSTAYKSKEIINTDDDLSTDTDEEKPLKPKSSPPRKASPEASKKRKREEPASSSKQDASDSDDSDVAPPDESSSDGEKSPPPKRSMRSRGAPVSAPADLPDDTFGEEEFTDGEPPKSPSSSDSSD